MTHPWTSVVSWHTDPETCGVARFSQQLAARLGVPCQSFDDPHLWGRRPLLSIKWAELEWPLGVDIEAYDQLWHDEPPEGTEAWARVWKLYEIGVPALVERPTMADYALFTFGMAHKIDLERFSTLAASYGTAKDRPQLWISTAAHEGAGPSKVRELMRVWGPAARDLGHLSDAALELVWPRVVGFVAFFEQGLRANNSSVHAALNAGVPVITNHDALTPPDLRRETLDLGDVRRRAWLHPRPSPYTWDRLFAALEAPCDKT
jgi:hypothetical protein